MMIADVKSSAFAMPLTRPAYPWGLGQVIYEYPK